MNLALLERLLETRREGIATALATELASGRQALILPDGIEGDLVPSPETLATLRAAIAADRSGLVETSTGEIFVEVWNPPLRLVMVGGVHIAQALVPVAALAGYRPIVIDPRSAFGSAERFPGIELVNEWPDDAMAALKPDKRTAIVTLTHDPKIDDPALQAALRSPAFYVGALGSRRTHAIRCERLAEAGFSADEIARIHGPVGLRIGAITPAEIAVSILAEITAVLRGAGGAS
ncbi:MAG TPA: XdhC family protein [Stellaceae bacterium]|nr:XdhC family protein [Stellaceae bacterium]